MRDLPILFSGPMVRALLSDRKTETRRIIKPGRKPSLFDGTWSDDYVLDPGNAEWRAQDIRWAVGDRLWVREQWSPEYRFTGVKPSEIPRGGTEIWYWADGQPASGDWHRPIVSIHMPRWISRITLLIDAVRVERVQDIDESGALAEGIYWSNESEGYISDDGPDETVDFHGSDPVESYGKLWRRINGSDAWHANPWVSATQFRVVRQNIDEVIPDAP